MLHRRRLGVGVAVTALFLVLLFFQVDRSEMVSSLADANYLFLAPAVAVYFLSVYFRAYRWRFLLAPITALSTLRLYPVVAVGYMANNLLPVRLGELVRSYYLARREPVPASTALATIIVERVFDGVVLLFVLAVAALFLPVAGLADRVSDAVRMPVPLVAAVVVLPFMAAMAAMVSMAIYPVQARRLAWAVAQRLPDRIGSAVDRLAALFIEGFVVLRRPRRLATVFLLSLPIWLAEGVMYYLIALGFDLDDHFETVGLLVAAIFLVLATSNLATSLPSSQGGVGPFEFFAVLTLVFLGVASGLATAYAVVLHLALLLPVVVVGLGYLAMDHLSLGYFTKAGRMEAVANLGGGMEKKP